MLRRKPKLIAGSVAGSAGIKKLEEALDYLRSVYLDPLQPTNTRLRAAQIAIEHERPDWR